MQEQIDKTEADIDRIWNQLAIYQFPKYFALYKVLTTFEYLLEYSTEKSRAQYGYESRPVELTHLRRGLQCIVPELLEQCPDAYFSRSQKKSLRQMSFSFREATDAISFSQIYEWISYYFTSYRQHLYDIQVKGMYVKFIEKADRDVPQSLLHHEIKAIQDEKARETLFNKLRTDFSVEEIIEFVKSTSTKFNQEEILLNVPLGIYENFKYNRMVSSQQPSIQNNIRIGGYTNDEYYCYWMCFSTVLSFYMECCKFKLTQNRDKFRNSFVLFLTQSDISAIVSQYSGLSLDATSSITSEMVLDISQQRPDIQVQPFIPVDSSNYVFVSPQLFSTANWEVCMLRLWAKKHGDEYGKLVASTKVSLSHNLALVINTNDNIVAENQNIRDRSGAIIAEVDLAVYNRETRYLFISEIKWEIEADSFQEDSHVQQDLQKGIDQIIRFQRLIKEDASFFISNLFPQKGIAVSDVVIIQYVLISNGGVDCGINTSSLNIEVLDYRVTREYLKTNETQPFSKQIEHVIELHENMKKAITTKIKYNETDLAGYRFATPGFDRGDKSNPSGKVIPQNPKGLCYCGSGKKYQDCCMEINSRQYNKVTESAN